MLHPKFQNFNSSQISISYQNIPSLASLNCQRPQNIRKITINHCNLCSLQGINNFINLEYLNVKSNNLCCPSDLESIENKMNVKEINISDNDIEYDVECSFLKMREKGFVNLLILNNKDYSRWDRKKKLPSTQRIFSALSELKSDMLKTYKRSVLSNVREQYRLGYDEAIEQSPRRLNKPEKSANQYSQNRASPLKDISLSNANMVRSVKVYNTQSSDERPKSYNPLMINPIQFGQNHMPITQPTATFASQRQRENMPFRSRNSRKTIIDVVLKDSQDYDDDEQMSFESRIQNTTHKVSVCRSKFYAERSLLDDCTENLEQKIENLTDAGYLQKILRKAFDSLKPKNIPLRMEMY